MAEWLKAHAWKACIPQGIQGSNPCLSAILPAKPHIFNQLQQYKRFRRDYCCLDIPVNTLFYPLSYRKVVPRAKSSTTENPRKFAIREPRISSEKATGIIFPVAFPMVSFCY